MTRIFNKKSQTQKRRILWQRTPAPESELWSLIRNRKISGQKFKRQFSIGRYVLDFYCPAIRLAIEIDGEYHQSNDMKDYDLDRQQSIESLGIKFLRFSNKEILQYPLLTKERVTKEIQSLLSGEVKKT